MYTSIHVHTACVLPPAHYNIICAIRAQPSPILSGDQGGLLIQNQPVTRQVCTVYHQRSDLLNSTSHAVNVSIL